MPVVSSKIILLKKAGLYTKLSMVSRLEVLGELTDTLDVTKEHIFALGPAHEPSDHTHDRTNMRIFRRYRVAEYRLHGLAGLAPKMRSDRGSSHGISPRMRKIVLGLRLMRRKRLRVRTIHHEACMRARLLGEPEPSEWQVRMVCASIADPDKLLSEGREKEFKNKYAITYTMAPADARNPQMVLEIDHTLVDVLAIDRRPKKYQKKSGEVRPWLTLVIERRSRLIMAAIFSYDRPDQYTVAAAIREAILIYPGKPYGGVPDIILVDNGKELLSHHIQHITQELHIILRPCIRHQPQQKGKVERTFGTLNTRLWSSLDGYVDSDDTKRNPHVKAKYTIAELEAKLCEYIQKYHHEVHSQLNMCTPLQYWVENCYAEPIDVRRLDALLTKAEGREVSKLGVQYRKRLYWNRELGTVIGKHVLTRATPSYAAPDEIEVYYEDRWVCTATAADSEKGKAVTAEEVRTAQQEQRQQIRQRIHEARDSVINADAEIAKHQQEQTKKGDQSTLASEEATHDLPSAPAQPQQVTPKEEPQGRQNSRHAPPPDLFNVLRAHYDAEQA